MPVKAKGKNSRRLPAEEPLGSQKVFVHKGQQRGVVANSDVPSGEVIGVVTDSLMRTFDEIYPGNRWEERIMRMNMDDYARDVRRAIFDTKVREKSVPVKFCQACD